MIDWDSKRCTMKDDAGKRPPLCEPERVVAQVVLRDDPEHPGQDVVEWFCFKCYELSCMTIVSAVAVHALLQAFVVEEVPMPDDGRN